MVTEVAESSIPVTPYYSHGAEQLFSEVMQYGTEEFHDELNNL